MTEENGVNVGTNVPFLPSVYANTFFLKGNPSEGDILIDLGEVCDLARVRLNGTDCGVVWKQPYRLSITEAVRSGENQLEVTVWNPWHNRLVGDVQPDCELSPLLSLLCILHFAIRVHS